jgi:predicted outer membrane repeat protein
LSFISGDITAIISRPTLTGNYAAGGGAVYSSSGSDRTLSDMTTSGNHSTGAGGGIYTAYAE